MNKIQVISKLAGLGIANILTPQEAEVSKVNSIPIFCEETLKEQDNYSLEEIDLVSVSDAMGNIEYFFVEEDLEGQEYKAITNIEVSFTFTITDLRETDSYWVPDSENSVFLINAKNFLEIHGYDVTKKYTKEELESLQDTFNSFLFNPYLWVKDEIFYIENLLMIGNEDNITIYDRNYYLSLIENVKGEDRTVLYYYDLTNFKKALKCHYGITLEEEQALKEQNDYSYLNRFFIEKKTSLYYKKEEKTSEFYIYDLSDFLTEEQKRRGYLYKFEIVNIIEKVNPKEAEMILALIDKNFRL